MLPLNVSTFSLLMVILLYLKVSLNIFNEVNKTTDIIVDEEFHLPLGEAYCSFDFRTWHPKVTTFPGLYLLSSIIFGPLGRCSTYFLRATSLICSIINIVLFYMLLSLNNNSSFGKNVLSAINIAILPPLYFCSHIYYTDVGSLTMTLLLVILSRKGCHSGASFFGFCAVLFRQTNIIWVVMVFGDFLLRELNKIVHRKKSSHAVVSGQELLNLFRKFPIKFVSIFMKTTRKFWLDAMCYASLIFFFVIFVILNGGIVVGDKSAHEAGLHLPQIFYFSLFSLFFTWPLSFRLLPSFINYVKSHKLATFLVCILCSIVIYYNTLVHPYLLADNRHYIFYVWNRFYGRYSTFRYMIIPVYLFALFIIFKSVFNARDVTFVFLFIPCTILVLVFQKLLELRYFFIPYVLYRTRLKHISLRGLLGEGIFCIIINLLSFYLFFTKTIEWKNYDYPQRLIW